MKITDGYGIGNTEKHLHRIHPRREPLGQVALCGVGVFTPDHLRAAPYATPHDIQRLLDLDLPVCGTCERANHTDGTT